jgi:ATP-dependent Clp protease ATP-binding subunit ClpC
MFERYTEDARRALFFARYEAARMGGLAIESEHLLLGLIRQPTPALDAVFARLRRPVAMLRQEIEMLTRLREKMPDSFEIPFAEMTRRILLHAGEEADRIPHDAIHAGHLLLGILREDQCLAASILVENGLSLDAARQDVAEASEIDSGTA